MFLIFTYISLDLETEHPTNSTLEKHFSVDTSTIYYLAGIN